MKYALSCPHQSLKNQLINKSLRAYITSYKTIGRAVGMSINTVQKYIVALGEKGFISIESTSVITKSGQKRNGSYHYTIRPIQEVVELYHQRQLRKLEIEATKSRLTAKAAV